MVEHRRGRKVGVKAKRELQLHPNPPLALVGPFDAAWQAPGLSRVERVIAFIEGLPITKGKLRGRKMRLLPHQRQFLEAIFTDKIGVRIAVSSMPKGNGKTGLCAGLALCFLTGPEAEERGEVYSAAVDRGQASIMFQEMEAIIWEVPELRARTHVMSYRKRIEVLNGPGVNSFYEALSADARTAHGKAPTLWLYDELAQAKDRELLDALMEAMGKRDKPLGIVLSTQSPQDTHPLSQLIDDGLTGADPSIYVQLLSAPPDADPFAEATWRACNPAAGSFLDEEDLRISAQRAQRIPAFEAAYRNLKLNQRIDANDQHRIVTSGVWKLGNQPVRIEDGAPCYGGLDLSGKHDLSALVLAFPNEDGSFELLPIFWTPTGQLASRTANEQGLFREWIRAGHINPVPGPVIEFSYVAAQVAALAERYDIRCIGYDRWRIDEFKWELEKLGADITLEPFGQGYKDMAPAVENFAELALMAKLHHGGHPVLTACVSNAILTPPDDAGNQKFAKGKANAGAPVRIDGVVAAAMALGTAKRKMADDAPSVYETRGLLELEI